MKVIAFSGWKKSGKDTAAEFLIKEHGAFRSSFADPLKNMAAAEYDVPLENFFVPELKEKALLQYPVRITDNFIRGVCELLKDEFRTESGDKATHQAFANPESNSGDLVCGDTGRPLYWTARALAIFKGSGNRSVDGFYWNNRTAKEIKASGAELVVITDLRFKTEVEFLRKTYGKDLLVVRVSRFATVDSNDPSERDLDNYPGFDAIITNHGTIEELYERVSLLV